MSLEKERATADRFNREPIVANSFGADGISITSKAFVLPTQPGTVL